MRVSNPIANSYTKNQANNKFVTVNLDDTEPGTPEKDKAIQLPIGFIFEWSPVPDSDIDLSTPEKVTQYFGYGTWAAFGVGQFLLGAGGSYQAGNTGGEAEHTLTTDEIPPHGHTMNGWTIGTEDKGGTAPLTVNAYPLTYNNSNQTTKDAGGGQAHNNMPPYIVVYRWQRTA